MTPRTLHCIFAATALLLTTATVSAGLLSGVNQLVGDLTGGPGDDSAVQPSIEPPADDAVTSIPVSFQVRNVNRARVICLADGRRYTLRGQIVGPADGLGRAATLYLHGLGYGNFFWRFQAVEGFDYAAEMAKRGHTSVVIDRLGYDASDQPRGSRTCVGAQADMAHQIIQQLRAGSYQATNNNEAVPFDRIALAGHSAGGQIAQVAAYSFDNIDALAVLSYADAVASPAALVALAQSKLLCVTGGERAEPGTPRGYAAFGQTDRSFQALNFFDVAPDVAEAATALRNRDPCGDLNSLAFGIVGDATQLATIQMPVLLVCGREDAIFPLLACRTQSKLYLGSGDVTAEFLAGIGHALTLGRQAPGFRDAMSEWLSARDF